ncbi:MAG: zinc ribbon domain-containing protein, partial [Candidatus Thermoplasmatota archaeon]
VMQFKQQYFPIYMFKRDIGGREIVFIEPAKTTTLPGMHNLKVPAGDIKIFDQKYDYGGVELIKPDIDMVAYLPNLQGEAKEQALVYFPIYNILYDYRGRNYQAVIDGSSGEVFATDYPPRAAAPYHILTIVGFIAFFIITLLYFLSPLVPLVGLPIFFIAMFYLGYYIAKNR